MKKLSLFLLLFLNLPIVCVKIKQGGKAPKARLIGNKLMRVVGKDHNPNDLRPGWSIVRGTNTRIFRTKGRFAYKPIIINRHTKYPFVSNVLLWQKTKHRIFVLDGKKLIARNTIELEQQVAVLPE